MSIKFGDKYESILSHNLPNPKLFYQEYETKEGEQKAVVRCFFFFLPILYIIRFCFIIL